MTRIITALLLIGLPGLAMADFLGLYVGTNRWQQDWAGDLRTSPQKLDAKDDFGFDDSDGSSLYVAFEHPIPVLPNIRMQQSEIDIDGEAGTAFTYDSRTFTPGNKTVGDLSHTDLTLYYEIIDTFVAVDIGLTARQFDGRLAVEGAAGKGEIELDQIVPLLYAAGKISLPFTGLSAGGQLNTLVFDNVSVSDWSVQIAYETLLGLGIEGGFRSFNFDFDDDDEEANITVEGAYLGVFFHF